MSYFNSKNFAKSKGFKPNEPIYLTDDVVKKYVKHPKSERGANVPPQLVNLMAKAITRPRNIYNDTIKKNKGAYILIGTIPKDKTKIIKVVIHTRFSRDGSVYHKVKSFGIVHKSDMKGTQYTKIK